MVFKPGQSGNPGGRPKGIAAKAREHTDRAIEVLAAGLDSEDERRRFGQHLREARKGLTPKDAWLMSLSAAGLEPILTVLVGDSADWEADEKRLVALHRKNGKLLNIADGGAAQFQSPPRPRGAYFKMMHRFQSFINEGASQFIAIRDGHRAQRKAALKVVTAKEYDTWLDRVFEGQLTHG